MPVLVKPLTGPGGPRLPEPVPLGLTYIDPDGRAWAWGDPSQNVFATACAGISSPPVTMTSIGLPGGGALPQFYSAAVRPIIIGLRAYNDDSDQAAFLAMQDALAWSLWTVRAGAPAPGTLVVSRPDGSSRQLRVFCIDGPDQGDDDGTKSGVMWSTYVVTLQAPDPFFEDAAATVLEFSISSAPGIPPMPPIQLASASLLGQTEVVNSGNADSYPVWTLTGPGTPTITNTTTGRSWGLSVALGSSEVVTVDTRPTIQSAVDGLGLNRWPDLVTSSPRDLWPLLPGMNHLNLNMAGSTSASKVVLSYTRKWLRA